MEADYGTRSLWYVFIWVRHIFCYFRLMRVEELMISSLLIAEEEARWLRFYMDEPCFTDLHWVTSISVLNGMFSNFIICIVPWISFTFYMSICLTGHVYTCNRRTGH